MDISNNKNKNKAEFVKLMLDNDFDKRLKEVKNSENFKNYRHRSNELNNNYLIEEFSSIEKKALKRGFLTHFTVFQKLIACILIGSLVIIGVVFLNM